MRGRNALAAVLILVRMGLMIISFICFVIVMCVWDWMRLGILVSLIGGAVGIIIIDNGQVGVGFLIAFGSMGVGSWLMMRGFEESEATYQQE